MLHLLASAALAALFTTGLVHQDPKPAPAPKPSTQEPAKKDTPAAAASFVVVKVGKNYEVAKKDDVAARRKELAAQHDKAMREWQAAKDAAKEAGTEFQTPAPVPTEVTVVPGEHASKDAAQAAVKKLVEAERKKADGDKGEKEKRGNG